ncbi:MAG: T9SS type A sorting domain-containing protein [Bacteroidota bacterium]
MTTSPIKLLIVAIGLIINSMVSAQPQKCFTAIHCDPTEPNNFPNLEKLVDSANAYNIKLTLQFTAPWVDSITPYPARLNAISTWHSQGHEIAMHHHDIIHPMSWDQYSNHSMYSIDTAGWDTLQYMGDIELLYSLIQSITGTTQIRTIGNSDSVDLPLNCIFQTNGILLADGFSNPVAYNYLGKDYCRVGYTFINNMSVENSIENLYPSMTSFSSLGVVFHVFNFASNPAPAMKWFRFINQNGLQSMTVAGLLTSFDCPSGVSSLSDVTASTDCRVYPVPFSETLKVQYEGGFTAELFGYTGDRLISSTSENGTCLLNTAKLAPGIYLLVVTINNKTVIVNKVVKGI